MPRARADRVAGQPAPRRAWPGSSATATRVTIGAATTLAQVGREVEFLHDAIESIASPTIRNLATVGGNLFVPQPHGDLAVCLLALDARVSIIDADGARDVGVLEAEGLVTAVSFDGPRALVLHEGDAPAPELGVDRHRRLRRHPDRARRRRARARCARPPPRRRSPSGDVAKARRAVRRGRRPVRRRLRQRLVPPPRPPCPRPPSSEPMPSSVIELEVNGEPSRSSSPSPAPRC